MPSVSSPNHAPVGAVAAPHSNVYVSALARFGWTWADGAEKTLRYYLETPKGPGWPKEAAEALAKVFRSLEAVADIRFEQTTDKNEAQLVQMLKPMRGANSGMPWANTTQVVTNFSTDYAFQAEGTTGYRVYLHEIAHALGIHHSFEPGGFPGVRGAWDPGPFGLSRSMFTVAAYASGWTGVRGGEYLEAVTPMAFDIAALQHLYGANKTTRTGNDVYTFDQSTAARCIYDAGGVDAISYSGPHRVKISLIAATLDQSPTGGGDVSFVRAENGWVAGSAFTIANGVVIENAFGGSGADTLIGNDADNLLRGGGGDDLISGGAGNDVLAGDAGNDTLRGGAGQDRYEWMRGQGNDRIIERASEGRDTLVFQGDIAPGDVSIRLAGKDVVVDVARRGDKTGGSILIEEQTAGGEAGIEAIRFENGTTWRLDKIRELALTTTGTKAGDLIVGSSLAGWADDRIDGAAGDDTIRAGDGDDVVRGGTGMDRIEGGRGNDVLYGGAGGDTFLFTAGDGSDRIMDFNPGSAARDLIVFRDTTPWTFERVLSAARDVGGDTVITFDEATVLTLVGVKKASLVEADFAFAWS